MADYDLSTIATDTDGPAADTEELFGSPAAGTPKPYSFAGIKTWIQGWITKTDVALGNVTNSLQLVASNNLSDLADAGAARNNLVLPPWLDPDFTDTAIYLSPPVSSTGAGILTANRIYMLPIWVPRTRTYTTYAFVLTTLAGTSIIRMGLYNADSSLQPTTKIDEGATTIDASAGTGATGLKTVAFGVNQSLKPGMYYLAIVSDGAPSGLRYATSSTPTLGIRFGSASTSNSGSRYRDAGASTLPADETAQTYSSAASGAVQTAFGGIR